MRFGRKRPINIFRKIEKTLRGNLFTRIMPLETRLVITVKSLDRALKREGMKDTEQRRQAIDWYLAEFVSGDTEANVVRKAWGQEWVDKLNCGAIRVGMSIGL